MVVNEIPNFTGVIARPRLRCGCRVVPCAQFPRGALAKSLDSVSSLPDALNAVVLDFLAVMGGVRFAACRDKDFVRRTTSGARPSRARDAIDNFLDDEHALRSAESAEGGVRSEIGFRDRAAELDVAECSRRYRDGRRARSVTARERSSDQPPLENKIDLRREQHAVLIETDFELRRETDGVCPVIIMS